MTEKITQPPNGPVSDTSDVEKTAGLYPESTNYKPVAEIRELKKVLKESAVGIGGLTALLLQVAHPYVARGVSQHSDFALRVFKRGENTAIFVYGMVYGTPEEQKAIKAWVDKSHSPVRGGEGSKYYNAMDPHAQLWVAATLYASMIDMYELIYKPLPENRAERVYQEFSVFATSLQVPPELWPKDRAAFWAYFNDMVQNKLEVVPEAKDVLQDVLHPKWRGIPLLLRPFTPFGIYVFKSIAIEQLPPRIVDGFGLRQHRSRFSQFTSEMTIAMMRAMYPFTPGFIRHAPTHYYLRKMRKLIKKHGNNWGV